MNLSDILDNNEGPIEVICCNGFRSKGAKDYIKHESYLIDEIFGLYFVNVLELAPTYLTEEELNSNFILLSEFRDRRIDSILKD